MPALDPTPFLTLIVCVRQVSGCGAGARRSEWSSPCPRRKPGEWGRWRSFGTSTSSTGARLSSCTRSGATAGGQRARAGCSAVGAPAPCAVSREARLYARLVPARAFTLVMRVSSCFLRPSGVSSSLLPAHTRQEPRRSRPQAQGGCRRRRRERGRGLGERRHRALVALTPIGGRLPQMGVRGGSHVSHWCYRDLCTARSC